MPFFKPAISNIKRGCVSLQVHKPVNKKCNENRICLRKRVCLSTSNGSITVEAAITTSFFMFIMLFVIGFLMIINIEITIQEAMNSIVMSAAKNKFYIGMANEISDKSDRIRTLKEQIQNTLEENEDLDTLIATGVNAGYLYLKLDSEIDKNTNKEKRLYSVSDINTLQSSVDNGNIDMVVQYNIKLPYVNKKLYINQRAFVKDWTGVDISKKSESVYITKTGNVYHTTRDCSHLVVNISKIEYANVEDARNLNGGTYSRCLTCINKESEIGTFVFITEDGKRFHSSLKCSGLKRSLITVDIDDIKDRKPCSECGGL